MSKWSSASPRAGAGGKSRPGDSTLRVEALKVRRGIASSERPHMPSRKFGIGEMVALKASVSRNVPGEVYEAIRLLPHNGA